MAWTLKFWQRHKTDTALTATVAYPQVTPAVEEAYAQLLASLEKANRRADERSRALGVSHEQALDLSEAGNILSAFPQLTTIITRQADMRQAREDAMLRPDAQLSSPTGSTPQAVQLAAGWSGSRDPIGVPNARVLRSLADSDPWLRAGIDIRRQQIGRADIAVVPADPLKPYSRLLMKRIQMLLDQPNEMRDSYRSLIEPVIEDILVLDRGVLSKNMSTLRKPTGLYYEDGATIKIYPAWNGNPREYRYLYEPPGGGKTVPLRNDECIVFIANPASYRFGLSPVQVLYDTVQADLEASKSAMKMVKMKPPPHALQILGATESQIRQMRATYEQEIAGEKEIFWFGGQQEAVHFPLVFSAKDNQWMEWQVYIVRKIAAVLKLSPQQFGITFDINKSTGETQQQIYEDTGLIPLLLLLEEQLNRELLADFAPALPGDRADLDAINLRIIYPEISETERQMHAAKAADIAVKSLGNNIPSMTINQVLAMRGEQPVPGGNTFYFPSLYGPIPFLSYEGGATGDYTPPSAGGQQGAQDPAGGPQANPKTERVRDKKPLSPQAPNRPSPQPAPNAAASFDHRIPGKHWTPYKRASEEREEANVS